MGDDESLWDGRYQLVRTLGEGGMGRVVLAVDRLQGDRNVALKRLLPAFNAEADTFRREFQIHRQLAHPNIPRVYELGHARDADILCPYFTLEVSDGVPLHDFVRDARLGLRAVFQIVAGLLRALDHVHRRGFVHGDVKPGNVLVAERPDGLHVHLIDFGVALATHVATPDEVLATPEYAAPEQLFGEPVDARTDLYAIGLLLYELVERRRPWLDSDPIALARQRADEPIPALTAPDCPPQVAALVRKLLAGAPAERPESAAEALLELSRATGWDADLEPPDAFVNHLLTVPLPWRGALQSIAAATLDPHSEAWATVIDVPAGYFARRLLGPVLDVAALNGARVMPLRFDVRFGDPPPPLEPFLASDLETPPRRLVVVIENIDEADDATLAAIVAHRTRDTRLVATRRDAKRELPAVLGDEVRVVALAPWTTELMREWVTQALGPIELPFQDLPPTPAALVEALGGLAREGRIVRTRSGYHHRPGGRSAPGGRVLAPTRRPETIDALVACIRQPIPERALSGFFGTWSAGADIVPALLNNGVLVARGDGTVAVTDESRRATTYGKIAAKARQGIHRRLAQVLADVGAPPHRIAEEWLASDAPLLAVPHLLAAAEARPGRSWLERSLGLVHQARALLADAARGAEAPDLELWRYAALVLQTEARLRLACGELSGIEPLIEGLAAIGSDMGHMHTIRCALELAIAFDRRAGHWDDMVRRTQRLVNFDANPPDRDGQAKIHLARALRFQAEGLPTAALTELDFGLYREGAMALELELALLQARAELCLEVEWSDLLATASDAYGELAERSGRSEHRARARIFAARRERLVGRVDQALALVRRTAESLPLQRTLRIDVEVELELGRCHEELGDFFAAREHARFAAAMADEEGDITLAQQARALEASAAFRLGAHEEAWSLAQRVDRVLALELALNLRGFAGADAVLSDALQAGYAHLRRLERARAARAFRVSAESALVRGESVLAEELASRALATLREESTRHPHLPRYLVTLAAACRAIGDSARATRLADSAQLEVREVALRIGDDDLRLRWLAHPEQQRALGLGVPGTLPRPTGTRKRVRTGSRTRPLS